MSLRITLLHPQNVFMRVCNFVCEFIVTGDGFGRYEDFRPQKWPTVLYNEKALWLFASGPPTCVTLWIVREERREMYWKMYVPGLGYVSLEWILQLLDKRCSGAVSSRAASLRHRGAGAIQLRLTHVYNFDFRIAITWSLRFSKRYHDIVHPARKTNRICHYTGFEYI